MARVYARCIEGRYIGFDWYGKGDVFVMGEATADEYQSRAVQGWDSLGGSFVTLGPAPGDAPLGPVPNYDGGA